MNSPARPIKLACLIVFGVTCLYVAAFVHRFEVLGAPVRSAEGWLGPLVRGDKTAVDIGKAYFTERPDDSAYRAYQPLCRVWLWLGGYD